MKMTKRKGVSYKSPFIYASRSAKTIYIALIVLLFPQIALLFIYHDLYAVLNVFSATTATLICQSIVYYKEKSTFKIPLEALLQGLCIGLFMPTNIGFLFVFICSFLGFSLSRVAFGKAARWVCSVVITLIIAYISHPELFSFTAYQPNLLQDSKGDLIPTFDKSITSFLNSYILNDLGITLPEGYISLFWNPPSNIPACRYNVITIISSIIFLSLRIYDFTISIVFIFVYSFLVYCFSKTATASFFSGDILSSIMGGALFFTLFFILGEPHSFPKTKLLKVLSGVFIAVLSFILSGSVASFITLSFGAVLLNVMSPYIEKKERDVRLKVLRSKAS